MGWAAELWADENQRRGQLTPVSSALPQDVEVTVGTWDDALERTARRCRGCGEWSFTELCDWCIDLRKW